MNTLKLSILIELISIIFFLFCIMIQTSSFFPKLINVIFDCQVIPNYSSRADYDKMFGLGVSMYGQMTAGSYCYIGPQGIVHGTTLTVLNAGRTKLGSSDLAGKVFFTSGPEWST